MSLRGAAYVAGIYEHPRREIPDRTIWEIHTEVALGALADAGLTMADVDAVFVDGTSGFGAMTLADHWGIRPKWVDSTETGGSSYLAHVGHAAAAIAAGKCSVALITLAGRPRTGGPGERPAFASGPETAFEQVWGVMGAPTSYALAARRHMHEFGTTSAQLAEIKVAASIHAQHNPNAFLRNVVTVEEVLASPMVADPLHRLDCCVVTDGGGALVVVSPEVAKSLGRTNAKVLGHAETVKGIENGRIDLTYTGAAWTGPIAFAEAGVTHADIKYASIYDSFTITVLQTIEDLGFCAKGEGGRFVSDGGLVAPFGKLPFNTDGGGLCNNHPSNRGGITKVIEAVRQLRGEAHAAVQVPNCQIALAHGTGGSLGSRHGSVTLILGQEDA
jgi:acetyl-CoA C-acetyltransferase